MKNSASNKPKPIQINIKPTVGFNNIRFETEKKVTEKLLKANNMEDSFAISCGYDEHNKLESVWIDPEPQMIIRCDGANIYPGKMNNAINVLKKKDPKLQVGKSSCTSSVLCMKVTSGKNDSVVGIYAYSKAAFDNNEYNESVVFDNLNMAHTNEIEPPSSLKIVSKEINGIVIFGDNLFSHQQDILRINAIDAGYISRFFNGYHTISFVIPENDIMMIKKELNAKIMTITNYDNTLLPGVSDVRILTKVIITLNSYDTPKRYLLFKIDNADEIYGLSLEEYGYNSRRDIIQITPSGNQYELTYDEIS